MGRHRKGFSVGEKVVSLVNHEGTLTEGKEYEVLEYWRVELRRSSIYKDSFPQIGINADNNRTKYLSCSMFKPLYKVREEKINSIIKNGKETKTRNS